MGPGAFGAWRLGALLWRGALSCGLRPTVGAGTRPPSGPPLGLAYLAPGPTRGLHGGTRPEERAEGVADEGRRESSAADHTSLKFDIDTLVSLLRQENARDICVIKVPPEYKYLKCKSDPHVKIEGKDTDDWLCVDFGNMVIHLMLPETRETYELEKLWTLRSYDDQLAQIASDTLPEDFILGLEDHTSSLTPVEFKCE
ncbi:mitochondrial assembly of ribosomal large subunit protein 1 isoform X2 [Trichechus manatus latirostris]|uniref:Mitochondrial assembly of ribosomal large subunit protein 1 isoform X2 n=1 Tax=Trichechus manatus latirostris TaxID=127582 RepID=A0A2Y9QXJ5_TRIMA|nr:mitochondrial assembly of ribosomal large subunit protein 1 isoform X2 [Trichechus manatus latirostris]